MDNVYLLFCLLPLMVFEISAKTLRNRYDNKRQKRALVESSEYQQSVEQNGMTLFNAGIKTLKGEGADIKGNFLGELKSIYNILENNPKSATDRIEEGLRNLNDYRSLPKTPAELKSDLIRIYTSNDYYKKLNRALNEHACTYKSSTDTFDQNIAAYATALLATLLYWPKLNRCSQDTFRGLQVPNIQDIQTQYKEGKNIVYTGFTSSSIEKDIALGFTSTNQDSILLVFDNSQDNFWKPRDIEAESDFTNEKEYLYPPAAKFRVTSSPRKVSENEKEYYEMHLQLVAGAGASSVYTDNISLVQLSRYPILNFLLLSLIYM